MTETLDDLLGHPDRARVLELLAEGPARAADLARRLGRRPNHIGHLIDPLRRHRLVARRPQVARHCRGCSGIRLVLTDAGRAWLAGGGAR